MKLKLGVLSLAVLTLCGCQTGYYLHLISGQTGLWWKRQSVESALSDPKVSEEQKRKIRFALEVKKFGEEHLLLTPGKNYSKYVGLDREAVSWLVVASPRWRVEAKKWHFVFVGEFPYKGYFDKQSALDLQKELQKQEFDTLVRPVSAFSYLGWMSDPLLSTFLADAEEDLADLILHESVHATLFIENNVDFNEQLATFVAEKGVNQLFQQNPEVFPQDTRERMKKFSDRQAHERELLRALHSERIQLQAWYQKMQDNGQTGTNYEQARQQRLNEIQLTLIRKGLAKPGAGLLSRPMNNAVLAAFGTYTSNLDDFEKAFEQCSRSWKQFWKALQGLKKQKDPLAELKRRILSGSNGFCHSI